VVAHRRHHRLGAARRADRDQHRRDPQPIVGAAVVVQPEHVERAAAIAGLEQQPHQILADREISAAAIERRAGLDDRRRHVAAPGQQRRQRAPRLELVGRQRAHLAQRRLGGGVGAARQRRLGHPPVALGDVGPPRHQGRERALGVGAAAGLGVRGGQAQVRGRELIVERDGLPERRDRRAGVARAPAQLAGRQPRHGRAREARDDAVDRGRASAWRPSRARACAWATAMPASSGAAAMACSSSGTASW
jgi:hypothetical protein